MRNSFSFLICLAISFCAQNAFSRETVGGQNRRSTGPGAGATEGVAIGELNSRLKNKKLADELTKLLEDCLPRVATSANRQLSTQEIANTCKVHMMGDCRTAEAALANAKAGTGAANSCHRSDNGCKAVDIGKIECGDFKLIPASEPDGNEYYLRLAKCMSGDTFEGDPKATEGSKGKQHSGGLCYHDPCEPSANTLGNCPNHSHTNHIHFSGDGCGQGEHAHAHSDAPTGPAASCGKGQAQNNMRRAT